MDQRIGFLETPTGLLRIKGTFEYVSAVKFTDEEMPRYDVEPSGAVWQCIRQLTAYFNGEQKEFDLRLQPEGTPFQQQVWEELLKIPFGETRTYQEMAVKLGDPKIIRAAANANGRNPIAILIPCHRVVGTDGSLTGYAGGIERKRWLLDHEARMSGKFAKLF